MEEANIQTWIDIAEEDLSTAEVCVQNKKYLWAMVMCQQAIEKILKAIYVKQKNEIPKKIHNLLILSADIGISLELTEDLKELFNSLLAYYLGSRYPDERKKLMTECNEEYSKDILNKTKETYLWLKKKL